ncbi:uncharacterized protein LOC119745184 [Patiria miniata]|uniref:Uncharacterized protein n=1 Tax=Patiria miniata TaxID=46514 RepID=A0A914BNQ2_PATMI|nr:uncharacterized protein LOC119745184 [Patiria miniata]
MFLISERDKKKNLDRSGKNRDGCQITKSMMMNHRRNKTQKLPKHLYPVGGYTKRIDQYGAVPAAVLAEERRLQQLEHRIERGRRWHLAQCEREERKAARHLHELNEAKGRKVWACLPAVTHSEYLYGGCLAVRVQDGQDGLERGKDAVDGHLRPQAATCHRTQAKTDLPKLLIDSHRPKKKTPVRKPRRSRFRVHGCHLQRW